MDFETSTNWVVHLTPRPWTAHHVTVTVYNVASALKTAKTRHIWFKLSEGVQYRRFTTTVAEDSQLVFAENAGWNEKGAPPHTYRFGLDRLENIQGCSPLHVSITFEENRPPLVVEGWRLFVLDWKSRLRGDVTLTVYLPHEITGRLQRVLLPSLARVTRKPWYLVDPRQSSSTVVGQYYLHADSPSCVSFISDREVPTGHTVAFKLQSLPDMLGGLFAGLVRFIVDLLKGFITAKAASGR